MTDYQREKRLVRDYYAALDGAGDGDLASALQRFTGDGHLWRGCHPFNEIDDVRQVAERFWQPLRFALQRMQRRMDVFMAGQDMFSDGPSVWVCSMGHLMGLFDHAWLGIEPTGKMAFLRYCEFMKVDGDRIVETAMFFDIPHLMMQAGLTPFPPQTAAHLVQPGPMPHDALLFAPQDPAEGERTLAAINAMVDDLGNWDLGLPLEEELTRTWHDDMIWWGPAGIGATYTIERYAKQHAGPFRATFRDRIFNGHLCRIAEGHYGGFFGWPNFSAVPIGGFMGLPATETRCDFRVIDIYRRRDDKLAENWIFIDLLHFLNQQGLDVLARMTQLSGGFARPV